MGGTEGAESDFRNADDHNVLLAVDKGVGEKGVAACFKLDNSQNGPLCRELNLNP